MKRNLHQKLKLNPRFCVKEGERISGIAECLFVLKSLEEYLMKEIYKFTRGKQCMQFLMDDAILMN